MYVDSLLLAQLKRLHLERFSAYAPDLDPVEMFWSYLQYGLMANFVPLDMHEVDRVVQGHLLKLGQDLMLIQPLWTGSRLLPINENLAT